MKRLTTVVAFAAAVLLSGCASTPKPPTTSSTAPSSTGPGVPYVAGNWQFSAASTVAGKPSFTFGGSLDQTSAAVSGALHVNGSSCFNQATTMAMPGTITTAGNVSLTSAAINGQVFTLTGNISGDNFTGTYSVSGGCDAGDQGTVTGLWVSIANTDSWSGTFTSSAQQTFSEAGNFAQNTTASADGSFGLSGTATADTSCFGGETVIPSSFPSGSFLLGTQVSLEIGTNNGTITFTGVVDPATEFITGTYSVVGGTCAQTGTASLELGGQWDY